MFLDVIKISTTIGNFPCFARVEQWKCSLSNQPVCSNKRLWDTTIAINLANNEVTSFNIGLK